MIYTVANPIYDSVFKFLMEDERIAKTLLSALLKKEVLSVEMRRHEHTNTTRNDISMFRIDFAARIKDDDGTEKLILIELQKTWVETETLRFRQYLAAQYNAKENMVCEEEPSRSYAVPMVAIYLLGHRVGKVKESVVYVNHVARNYEGQEVEEGMKDPFINSLVHDSIIVQLPLLKDKITNHLERVLSVFDQKHRDSRNTQFVNLDGSKYEGDAEMMRIIQRLTAATVNADLRQEMNVEDEFFSAIEERDTAIMKREKKIAEMDERLAEQDEKIAEQDDIIAEQDGKLAEQDEKLAKQDGMIAEKDGKLAEQNEKLAKQDGMIAEKDGMIAKQDEKLAKQNEMLAGKDKQLRAMAKLMLDSGTDAASIAKAMGMSQEEVTNLLEEK